MSTTAETARSNYVVCPKCKGDYRADPFRKCGNCLNGRVLAPQPAPDAEGEWRQSGYDPSQLVAVSDGRVVATCGNADIAAQIIRDRAAAETHEDETYKEI